MVAEQAAALAAAQQAKSVQASVAPFLSCLLVLYLPNILSLLLDLTLSTLSMASQTETGMLVQHVRACRRLKARH